MRTLMHLWVGLLVLMSSGCSAADPGVRLVRGPAIDKPAIDGKPVDLLPAGALLVGQLDAARLFNSRLNGQVNQIIQRMLPPGPESNFVPQRDVRRVYTASYAMQGTDFCAVLQGNFDIASIQRAAQARMPTPSGAALVQTRYGGYDLYTASNVGFVVLTPFTILSGNETGLRRALDRLRFGWTQTNIKPWMEAILADEKPAFSMVGDVSEQYVLEAVTDHAPFVQGLQLVRILGDFQNPGMNVVGSFTYRDPQTAHLGAENLAQLQQLASFASLLSTWGFGGSVPTLQVKEQADHVSFATRVDVGTSSMLLSLLAGLIVPS